MRVYEFVFNKEEDRNYVKKSFFDMFRDCEDFKTKKITLSSAEDTKADETKYQLFISVDDVAAGSYSVIVSNAFNQNLYIRFICVKDGTSDTHVDLPSDVKILSWYNEDVA